MTTWIFIANSLLLGVALAMDAFSVSMANGLHDPHMSSGKANFIALTFAAFQFLMPMIGWVCVHTIAEYFQSFQRLIPWIALLLLSYIGGKMIWDAFHESDDDDEGTGTLTAAALFVQGIATSIDALSVGFTIADYQLTGALVCSLLIAAVTYLICITGVKIGKTFGNHLAGKASILGGVILIGIGLEIFISHLF